jgi:hypothetical protein
MRCSCTTHTQPYTPAHKKPNLQQSTYRQRCSCSRLHSQWWQPSKRQVNCSCQAAHTSQPTNKQSQASHNPPTPLEQATHRRPGLLRRAAVHTIHTRQQHTQTTQQAARPQAANQAARRHAVATHNAFATQPAGSTRVRRPRIAAAHVHTHTALFQVRRHARCCAGHNQIKDACQCCCPRLQVLCMGQAVV